MKLTDEDVTRLAAEKVMGWKAKANNTVEPQWIGIDGTHQWQSGWSPLTEWRNAGQIVDKMLADGWNGCSLASASGQNMYDFFHGPNDGKSGANAPQDSMPRSITIAALLAVGAITEDQL